VPAAVSGVLDRSPHVICEHELSISAVRGLVDRRNSLSMDEVFLGVSDSEALSCAIELTDLAPDMTQEILSMFFQNQKRSGGDQIEDVFYCADEHRAVITFLTPGGRIAPIF